MLHWAHKRNILMSGLVWKDYQACWLLNELYTHYVIISSISWDLLCTLIGSVLGCSLQNLQNLEL